MTDEFGARPPPCDTCGGSGTVGGEFVEVTQIFDITPRFVPVTDPTTCPACGGSGRRSAPRLLLLPPPPDDERSPPHV